MGRSNPTRKRPITDDDIINSYPADEREAILYLTEHPVEFCKYALGVEPNKWQIEALTADPPLYKCKSIFCAGRQYGKSYLVGLLYVYYMVTIPGFVGYVMSTSGKLSNHVMQYVETFLQNAKLPIEWKRKGDQITVGKEGHDESTLTLLRTGLLGNHCRGFSTFGRPSLICWDEYGSYLRGAEVKLVTGHIGDSSLSGEIVCSTPTYVGSEYHNLFRLWSENERRARVENRQPRYRVFRPRWSDCAHVTRDRMRESYLEAKALGNVSLWKREHGFWVSPKNVWFANHLIDGCIDPSIRPLTPGDIGVWSLDIGGLRSPIVLGLFAYRDDRLECCDMLSYMLADSQYVQTDTTHQILDDPTDLLERCIHLRKHFGAPSVFYYDPNHNGVIGNMLENHCGFAMQEVPIKTYESKLQSLRTLERLLAERRVAFKSSALIDELRSFAPGTNPTTGRYVFPDKLYDHISALIMASQYLGGENRQTPFAFIRGELSWA